MSVRVAGVVGLVLALGCSGLTEKATEMAAEQVIEHAANTEGKDVDVDLSGASGTVKTDEGTVQFGEGTQVPADWPADVPVYPGATVQAAMTMESGGVPGHTLSLMTNDPVNKVAEFYRGKLSGLNLVADVKPDANSVSLMYQRADGKGSVMVSIVAAGGPTMVSLTATR